MPSAPNSFAKLSDNTRGIFFILAAAVFAVASFSQTKYLSDSFTPFQIAWVRACVTVLVLMPFVIRQRFRGLWPARLKLMLLRSVNAGLIILLNVTAVGRLPLVDFSAIQFTTPIFVIALSIPILGLRPNLKRSIATLVGFMGVLVIVRPTGEVQPAMGYALGGAICLALGLIMVRLLSRTESQLRLMLWSNGFLVLALAAPGLLTWQAPSALEWGILITAGITGSCAQACVLLGYQAGDPSVIAPFDYSRILIAVAVGYLFFGELPDAATLAGAALVICAGFYIARARNPAG